MSPRRSLTEAELVLDAHGCQCLLEFGHPVVRQTVESGSGRRRELVFFEPGSVFCLDMREANSAGRTHRSKIFVLEAGAAGDLLTSLPGVEPGAKVLIEAAGARRCKFLLAWIAALGTRCDPARLPASFFMGRSLWLQSMVPERCRPTDLDRAV